VSRSRNQWDLLDLFLLVIPAQEAVIKWRDRRPRESGGQGARLKSLGSRLRGNDEKVNFCVAAGLDHDLAGLDPFRPWIAAFAGMMTGLRRRANDTNL
jgi:hypothetical protein